MKISKTIYFTFLSIGFLLLLAHCGKQESNTSSTNSKIVDIRALEKLMPANPVLAEKYNRSCINCHANPDAKAHLVHDEVAWNQLINEKGLENLLVSVNQGYKNMPLKGQCADCTDEDFKQLILFMAGQEGKNTQ